MNAMGSRRVTRARDRQGATGAMEPRENGFAESSEPSSTSASSASWCSSFTREMDADAVLENVTTQRMQLAMLARVGATEGEGTIGPRVPGSKIVRVDVDGMDADASTRDARVLERFARAGCDLSRKLVLVTADGAVDAQYPSEPSYNLLKVRSWARSPNETHSERYLDRFMLRPQLPYDKFVQKARVESMAAATAAEAAGIAAAAFAACGRALGTHGAKIAGCLCASYIGGSLNFAATAQALDVVNAGGKALLTGAMAADNLAMCAYLAALFAIKTSGPSEEERSREVESGERVLSGVTAASACASLAMALIVLELSRLVAAGFGAPSLSLGVACVLAPIVSISASTIARTSKSESRNLSSILAFSGSQPMSEALMLLFFATLGAMVDLRTIFATLSGGAMLPFIAILLTTQLVFTLLVGHKLLKIPLWAVLVAANANVGGPATAAAMAAARGWRQAFAPAVATGIFGYSIATLIGVAIGNFLA